MGRDSRSDDGGRRVVMIGGRCVVMLVMVMVMVVVIAMVMIVDVSGGGSNGVCSNGSWGWMVGKGVVVRGLGSKDVLEMMGKLW